MHSRVIAYVHNALEGGMPVALAVLAQSGRDTPGIPGSLMAVRPDGGQMGTIGGGAVEAAVVSSCLEALGDPSAATLPFDYSLRQDGGLDMLCGGEVKGLITILRPDRRLLLFGGGHIGQRLYEAALAAGFEVCVVDDRPELETLFPRARFVVTEDFHATARELSARGENYIVIVTRGHEHDMSVLSAVVGSGAPYIGMIGSRGKVRALLNGLRAQGASEEALGNVYSPIGLEIDDGTPGEIAIGIMAEILAVKNRAQLRHCRDRAR